MTANLMHADIISPSLKSRVKRVFDAGNRDDLRIFKNFLNTGSWGATGCPFFLEWPWLEIPNMISHKIAVRALDKI